MPWAKTARVGSRADCLRYDVERAVIDANQRASGERRTLEQRATGEHRLPPSCAPLRRTDDDLASAPLRVKRPACPQRGLGQSAANHRTPREPSTEQPQLVAILITLVLALT